MAKILCVGCGAELGATSLEQDRSIGYCEVCVPTAGLSSDELVAQYHASLPAPEPDPLQSALDRIAVLEAKIAVLEAKP